METVRLCDRTLQQEDKALALSFREKIELSKMIDRLEVDVIELAPIRQKKIDSLLIKSIASAVTNASLAVPVPPVPDDAAIAWAALKTAKHPRLQVFAPVSGVQMEYLYHMKPAAMLKAVAATVEACAALTPDVEFVADDATRSDPAFLREILSAAICAGAKTVTVRDAAGAVLPEEFAAFVAALRNDLPALNDVTLGVGCSDALSLASACAVAAIGAGAREIKAASCPLDCVSLGDVVRILAAKGEHFNVRCSVRTEEIRRIISQINGLCRGGNGGNTPFENGVHDHGSGGVLTVHDSRESVIRAAERLGYDLSAEDEEKVFAAFLNAAGKKDGITLQELDAIVAAEAMQVPPVYTAVSYVINTGSGISSMAHMKLNCKGHELEGISVGDGSIDAAFLAIEQAVGRHFELDDFQIRAISEGREAMGETIVRLRSDGRLYSGRGISTDIVGASIMAYLNALNKIAYEEDEA
ncbi:MAG: alpha-isopropylmalate synthase regulatory domain-containing protein [Clostridia bacterium]|nr:alpha-isopropylmalate synthase regulatory domain-containing protein [Clostridia bacterium]